MRSGIYKIANTITGDFYVGSTTNFDSRKNSHFGEARGQRHHSMIFQRAWNKYGEAAFEFEILETCPPLNLLEREQWYLDKLNPYYNIAKVAGAPNPPPNKPIVRVDENGERKVYNTRDEAALEGFNEGEVTACCLGRADSHQGYRWEFEDGTSPEFVSNKRITPVKRIDPETKEEVVFASMTEAAKTGFEVSAISACCLNTLKTHRGYFWRFVDDDTIPEYKDKLGSVAKESLKKDSVSGVSVSVESINLATGESKVYASMADAKKEGFNQGHISDCCLGKRHMHKGHFWRYYHPDNEPVDVNNFSKREFGKMVIGTNLKTGEEITHQISKLPAGFNRPNIFSCCNGGRQSHKGYSWRWEGEPSKSKAKASRKVVRVDKMGAEQVYDSCAATAADGFLPAKVGACCMGRRKSHGGYTWAYADAEPGQ